MSDAVELSPTGRFRRGTPFWDRVDKRGAEECWEWLGARSSAGYGQIRIDGSLRYAHRHALALVGRAAGPGEVVCHHCDNPPCCNPAHLFVGTARDNAKDAAAKGRVHRSRGELSGKAKLTTPNVVEIRDLHARGVQRRDIAERFGIAAATVTSIVARKRWAHV